LASKKKYVIAAGVSFASVIVAGVVAWSRRSKAIHTEIDIQASDRIVWQVITDFPQFHRWNPLIRRIQGNLKEGSKLKVRIQAPGEKGMTFRPTILKIEPNKELRWVGRLAIPGLFVGEEIFMIKQHTKDTVRFIHKQTFNGLFALLYTSNFDNNIRQGSDAMNLALKVESERKATSSEKYSI